MFAGKRFGSFVAAVMVLGATSVGSTARASETCTEPHGTQVTRTFEVDLRAARAVYEVGERAVFRATVTRVVDGQAIGPVEGARVGFVASVADTNVAWGVAVTDADGKAIIKSRIRAHEYAGWADVWAFAEKQTADVPCHLDEEREFGEADLPDLFRTVN